MSEYFSLKVFAKNVREKRMQIEVPGFIFIKRKPLRIAEHFIRLYKLLISFSRIHF